MALSDNIRAERARKGWTQEELASRIGKKQTTVAAYENGQCMPSLKVLTKLAHELGKTPAALLADPDDAKPITA